MIHQQPAEIYVKTCRIFQGAKNAINVKVGDHKPPDRVKVVSRVDGKTIWDYVRFRVDENAQQTNHNNAIILIFRRKDGRWLRRGPAISDCLSEPCRRLRLYLPPPFPPLDPLSTALFPLHATCSSVDLKIVARW